jgi:hypothetical protein
MKIDNYIDLHGLTSRDVHSDDADTWIPVDLSVPEGNDFKVFANDEGTHVVVIDTTADRFKIHHGEIVPLATDWLDSELDYETDARPFWKPL